MISTNLERQRLRQFNVSTKKTEVNLTPLKKSVTFKSPTKEKTRNNFKQKRLAQLNNARIKQYAYRAPKDLQIFIQNLKQPGQDFIKNMYEQELDRRGMANLIDQQNNQSLRKRTNRVLEQQKNRIKKEAVDIIKKNAKSALKKTLKSGMKSGGKALSKTFWSSFAQGSVAEVEGIGLWSWFGSGTAATTYQSLISVLHGGKKLLGKGVISWIEPDPFKLPSQNILKPNEIATSGGTNILIGLYDLFGLTIITPVYIFLLIALFILANAMFIITILPYAIAGTSVGELFSLLRAVI